MQVLSEEERVEGSKRRALSHCKTFARKKNGVRYNPATFTYFQRSIQRHLNTVNTKGSMENLPKEDGFKPLNFLEKF